MDLARKQVISAIPNASISSQAIPVLRRLDPADVARVAADESVEWWRRQPCALSLEGRVPEALAPALWARVKDDGDVAEVRVALLAALGTWWAEARSPAATKLADQALKWLRTRPLDTLPYGMDQAVILARSQLGDLEVADLLARLAHDPWSHRAAVAEQATAAFISARGQAALLGAFGVDDLDTLMIAGPTPHARHFGVKLWQWAKPAPDPAPLLIALHDESIIVAQAAAALLHRAALDDEVLLALFDRNQDALWVAAQAPAPLTGRAGAAAWALVVAGRRCIPAAGESEGEADELAPEVRARLDPLDAVRVPLPGVPQDVREAILRAHLPGERTTDPRFHLEGLGLGGCDLDAEAQHPGRAHAALAAAGVRVREPTPIGEVYGQGGGSYAVIDAGGTSIDVCTIGPFARSEGSASGHIVGILESVGLRFIDAELGARVFEGLGVYYFGKREPLTVGELLFYWQD